MAIPNSILQQVVTYNDAKLAYLQNLNCFISTLNTKFQNFNDIVKNLGDTVNIELPFRAIANNGLVANFQGTQERFAPIVCDQAANVAHAFTTQDFIFNVREYMEKIGKSRVEELSAVIEANVAKNADSSVPVMTINNMGQSVPTGALHTESGPYRFYGDGVTPIDSFQKLAEACAYFRTYGAAAGELKFYMDDIAVVSVVGSGQNQFVPARNDSLSNAWDLGTYKGSNTRFYQSNLLPIHYSGTLGEDGVELTLVSTNDPTGANITELTFSGAGTDAEAVKSGDLGYFTSTALRYLTFTGHQPSKSPVQIRVTEDAASSGGNVTVSITPALQSTNGPNKNLNMALEAGMKFKFIPSHRCGLIVGGNAFYLAMPRLPEEVPYPTAVSTDKDVGVSLRNYYGSQFGQNQRGYVTDAIWTALAVPEYSMRVCFPINP